ncbi:kinase-like domain-containing protein [Flagelloscypha sp. PMI_526]|nr:kinase-like domain-containing protein [Flagelloscypha sp. PMI_526]
MLRTRAPRLRLSASPSRSPSRSRTRAVSPRRSLATHAPGPLITPPLTPNSPLAHSIDKGDDYFYNYTSGRWLYNESQQMAVRHSPFNVEALKNAVKVRTGSPIKSMEKKEGVFNKSFMCTLEDGRKVTARIKNPVAGPVHFTTASEVATMDFVRTVLGVPVPKILHHCSRAETEDPNAEFIIMENAPGVQLDTVWETLTYADKKNIVASLVDIEQRLLTARFASYGNLYYKTDVDEKYRSGPLLVPESVLDPAATEKFCIGPSAQTSYHEDERGSMDINRGPWKTPEQYLSSIAEREEAWIQKHAKNNIHDDPVRFLLGSESKEEHIASLQQYRSIVPAIVPKDAAARASVLWHPDLNLGNIFVERRNGRFEISQIIDWQGACVAPAYLQVTTPVFLKYQSATGSFVPNGIELPKLPDNFATLPQEEKEDLQARHRLKMLQKIYDLKQVVPNSIPNQYVVTSPVLAAGRTWKDGVLPLRLSLMDVAVRWQELNTPDKPCPLQFTQTDVEKLNISEARWMELHDFHDYLRSAFGIRSYGWVPSTEEFNKKRALLGEVVASLPTDLKTAASEVFPRGWWPFQDRL